jgi:hypothetical protein
LITELFPELHLLLLKLQLPLGPLTAYQKQQEQGLEAG